MATEPWALVEDVGTNFGVARDAVCIWLDSRSLPAHKIRSLGKFNLAEVDEWGRAGGANGHHGNVDEKGGR